VLKIRGKEKLPKVAPAGAGKGSAGCRGGTSILVRRLGSDPPKRLTLGERLWKIHQASNRRGAEGEREYLAAKTNDESLEASLWRRCFVFWGGAVVGVWI